MPRPSSNKVLTEGRYPSLSCLRCAPGCRALQNSGVTTAGQPGQHGLRDYSIHIVGRCICAHTHRCVLGRGSSAARRAGWPLVGSCRRRFGTAGQSGLRRAGSRRMLRCCRAPDASGIGQRGGELVLCKGWAPKIDGCSARGMVVTGGGGRAGGQAGNVACKSGCR